MLPFSLRLRIAASLLAVVLCADASSAQSAAPREAARKPASASAKSAGGVKATSQAKQASRKVAAAKPKSSAPAKARTTLLPQAPNRATEYPASQAASVAADPCVTTGAVTTGAATTGVADEGAAGRAAGDGARPCARIQALPGGARRLTELTQAPSAASPSEGRAAAPVGKKPFQRLAAIGPNRKGPLAKLTAAHSDSLVGQALELVGLRYTWGGESPSGGLDCSGLVRYVFGKLGVGLPHSAREIATLGEPVARDTALMRPGDVLYFGATRRVDHVGLYIGNGRMVHAASRKRGVVLDTVMASGDRSSRLWYWRNWKGVRRLTTTPPAIPEF